jgi:RimJ/RimL family protein N-acetyltransferase
MVAGGTLSRVLRHPDPPLSDGVITLRDKSRDDIDALVTICQDPAIPRWTRVPVPYTRRDAEAWIAVSELEREAGTGIDWLAEDEHGAVVASLAIQHIRAEQRIGEVGYWVAAPARGRGIATRGVRLVTAWGLGDLGLETLEIMTHEDNLASQGVARAAGYEHTGDTHVPPREGLPPGRYVVFTTGSASPASRRAAG